MVSTGDARRMASPQRRKVLEKARIGDIRSLHAVHFDPIAGGEAGNGAEHRDAVIAPGGDLPPDQATGAVHDEAVGCRLDVGAQAAQPADDGIDAIGFLQPQFPGAADDRLTVGKAVRPSMVISNSSA